VLRKCLARDPARRYANPHELRTDLELVRERRAPRITRRSLEPLQRRRDHARRVALRVAAAACALLVLLALTLPRLLGRARGADPAVAAEAGPFEPLAELAARRTAGLAKPAEHLAELLEMEPRVPLGERLRYEELVRAVDTDVRRTLREVRTTLEDELEAEIQAGDLEAGWRTLADELEPRFLRATGFGLAGLKSVNVDLAAWRERLEQNLHAATDTALSELEALLLDWRSARLGVVEDSLDQQDWERALSALTLPEEPELLRQAGFGLRLPAASKEGLLYDLTLQFRRRSERLRDDWQDLDRELRTWVLTRRGTLERTLREGPPRLAAEARLREDFERELFDRRLSRDKMPHGLSRAALEELEASARALAVLEEALRDEDARADHAALEELADDALRRRDYGRALGLWEEARERRLEGPRGPSSVRTELARRADVRAAEARVLDALLERAAERIRLLDGRAIELRLGSIVYSDVRIQAGPDPRRDGFRVDKIAGVLRLAELPSPQLEAFVGLASEAELGLEERLTLAAFRFHEGRVEEAQRALFSGALPDEGPLAELGPDLAARIAAALERGEERAGEREAEALALLDAVLDPEFQEHSPRVAQARVARLLDFYGDLALVKQQRAELQRIRASLEARAPRDAEREFRRVFAPDTLELSPLARVRLGYDFGEGRLGAWEGGDWVFDGLGLVLGPRAPIQAWDQLVAERGPRLILRAPLEPDTLEVVVRFEALQGESPARLLWLTAAGFQIALCAPDLPGGGGAPRFLVGTEEGGDFLQRFLAGEGERVSSLLVPGTPPRELRFAAQRRSGRCQLYLDGSKLYESAGLRAPPSGARTLQLRSWGSVRVLAVELEGGR
jgi:hypothetical protein